MLLIEIGMLSWGVFIGLVGFALFLYGKKRPDAPALVAGIVLMVYPYFISSLWVSIAVGAGIIAAYAFLKFVVR